MSTRNVSVRLTANVDAYNRAMDQARGSTAKLEKDAGRNMSQLGGKMQDVGKKATLGVSVPLVGVGAASIKMANNFDASMSKIVGLVGLSTDEVDGMKESVLGLAGETARSPQELADALFVVTSAGLRGGDALSTLEMAAKASAAGLGETKDIARAVAGAVNAYGPSVLDAAHATDVLTATARAGNFETSELASSLGKVLPFAKQAQASFEDVGGAVALLTRTNGNASESITQVQALMRAFVVPTAEAATVLGELGLSAEDVRDSIGENGLVATLEMLDGKLGGNREQLGRMIGSSEGASAAFQILDADAATLADTFGVTNDAVGMVGDAFGTAADTDAFKMQQAMNDLRVAAIELGAILGPIVADIAGGVSDLAGAFSDLDPVLQKIIVGIAAAAAAAGPLLIATGSLVKNYAMLKTAVAGSNMTMAGSAAATKTLAAQLGLAYVAVGFLDVAYKGLRGETDFLYDDTTALGGVFNGLARDAYELFGGTKSATAQWKDYEEEAAKAFATTTAGVYTMEQLRKRLDESTLSIDARNLITIAFRKQLDATAEAEANLAEATAETTEAVDESTEAIENTTDAAKVIQAEIDKAASNVRRFGTDGVENMGSVEEAADATAAEIQTLADEFAGLLDQMSDRGRYLDAQDGFDAVKRAAEESYTAAAEGAEDAEAKSRAHERAVMDLTQDVIGYADEIGNIPEETVSDIIALIDQDKLAEAEAALAHLERVRNARINVTTYYNTGNSSSPTVTPNGGARALGGPTYPGKFHEVLEGGRSELLTKGNRTYLMSASHGFVTPLQGAGAGGTKLDPSFDVRVFVGNQEIKDVVRVEVSENDRRLVSELRGGLR